MKRSKNGHEFVHAHAKYLACVVLLAGSLGGSAVNAGVVITDTGPGTKTIYFPSNTMNGTGTYYEVPRTYSTSSGTFTASAPVALRNPSGVPITITAAGSPVMSKVGALVKKALPLVPVLGTGIALYDLAKELNFDLTKQADGSITAQKTTYTSVQQYSFNGTVGPTAQAAGNTFCSQPSMTTVWTGEAKITDGNGNLNTTGPYGYCKRRSGSWDGWYSVAPYGAPIQQATTSASTLDQLASDIAAKSGWPSNSKLPDAVKQAETVAGEKVEVLTPTVSGPASSTGTTSSTSNADGTSTTKTVTHNHTYTGNTINTSTVTVTQNFNPTTNITTTSTETKTPDPQTKTDCEKNPDALGCKTLDDVPTTEVPKTTKTVTWAAENLGFGNGSCPAPLSVSTALGSVSLNLASYCTALETYAKPVLIALAMLTALFIVAPVRTEA